MAISCAQIDTGKKGALHTFPNWTFCSLNLKKDKSCFAFDLQTDGCRIRSNGLLWMMSRYLGLTFASCSQGLKE